jgi:hypothetical protein
MLRPLRLLCVLVVRLFRSRRDLLLENLALRQQLSVLRERRPVPQLPAPDKLFWVILRRFWPGWKRTLVLVQPETVVRWHRAGFKLYWKWLSRHPTRAGRRCVNNELRGLIFRMMAENQTWGAVPRQNAVRLQDGLVFSLGVPFYREPGKSEAARLSV